MLSSIPPPSSAAAAQARLSQDPRHAREARGIALAKTFPWFIFFTCFIIFFLMDQKMDAPLTSLEDRIVSDVAQAASQGDSGHQIETILLGSIGAFLVFRYRHHLRIHSYMAILFGAYFAWCCLGIFTADEVWLSFRRLGGFALSLVLCAGLSARLDVDSNSMFMAGIPTLTLLLDIIAELKSHGLEALTANGRFGGTYPHPNITAAALAIPVIVFTWMTLRTKGALRLAFATLDLVVIGFFVLTRSRTSILAVLVAVAFSLAIIVIRNQRQNLGRLLGTFVLIAGITGLAGLAVYSAPSGFNLLSVLHSERDEGDPTTLTGRVDLWKNVLEYAYERPVLGFGFGGFWSAKHIETISAEQQWPINQAHSAYIDQVLAVGFPGAFLSVLVALSGIFICTGRFFRYDNAYGVWAGLLVFISVHNLTEAISLSPGFLSFVLSLMSIQLALVKPLPAFIHKFASETELSRVVIDRRTRRQRG